MLPPNQNIDFLQVSYELTSTMGRERVAAARGGDMHHTNAQKNDKEWCRREVERPRSAKAAQWANESSIIDDASQKSIQEAIAIAIAVQEEE